MTNEVVDVVPVEVDANKKTAIAVKREEMPMAQLMEMSAMLAKSTIVPVTYQNRPENVFIALDMSSRMGVSPMVVMQNLHVIQGKPSFSGAAIGAMLRADPSLENVELVYVGTEEKDDWGAYITAKNKVTGKTLKGGTVTIAISKKEGWYQKSGSKWQTMPELMLAYRAYAWFGRVHRPELMMGLQSTDEVEDVVDCVVNEVKNPYEKEKK